VGDLVEMAMSAISQAQRRVEIAAQNLGNAATPSYKRRVAFSTLVAGSDLSQPKLPQMNLAVDQRSGKLVETGNPANLAISGPGYFALRRDAQVIYTRNGQLSLDAEGRLADANGFALQLANGQDLIVKSAAFAIGPGGVAKEKGAVLGTVAVYALDPEAASLPQAEQRLQLIENPEIRQGMTESSNVSTGDEMVAMIEALRRAEAGQRVMTVYDDLIGRVITSFGDSAR
jgi:flagellar basal-body rod protein FlgF